MYRVPGEVKRDPVRRWALPDRVFFACGACHVLAFAFLERHGAEGQGAIWLKPASGFTGNHIVVMGRGWVFDYHGVTRRDSFLRHTWAKARRWWPGWDATLVPSPPEILVSEARSRTYDGLWLREPGGFLHDALPRARRFLDRLTSPTQDGNEGLRAVGMPGVLDGNGVPPYPSRPSCFRTTARP